MTAYEYSAAHDLGYAAAEEWLGNLMERDPFALQVGTKNADDLRDAVHPRAFSDALDALPDVEATHVSTAVDAGITDAYEVYR